MQQDFEGFRLSPQQKHLWQLQNGDYDPIYRVHANILIEGKLDQATLNAALERVLRRHEILNTTFRFLPGLTIPVQVINEPDGHAVEKVDLSGAGEDEQRKQLSAFVETAVPSLNIERGPLVNISETTLSPDRHVLQLSLPALCADSETINNITSEISREYAAKMNEVESEDDEIMQYADIAEWLNELLESEEGREGITYWRQVQEQGGQRLTIPFEKKSSDVTSFRPARFRLAVDSEVYRAIKGVIEQRNTTLQSFLLACWQIYLHRITGASDFVLGVATDGRTYEELQGALGPLAKYLPMYRSLSPRKTFQNLMSETEQQVTEMLEWQEYFSWDKLGNGRQNGEVATGIPIGFSYHRSPQVTSENVTFTVEDQFACIDRFKLNLSSVEKENELITEFHYDTQFFSEKDIERVAAQFHVLVASAVSNPEAEIGMLDILDEKERTEILVDLNNTSKAFPEDKCLHQLFEEQAAANPDVAAVICDDNSLTYKELNERADQLAAYLRQLGVGPDVLVGIYVDPSPEMMVGLLGIMKSGGAYVPLDPEYPKERIVNILEDTETPIVLTQEHLKANIPNENVRITSLDTEWEQIEQAETSQAGNGLTSQNLAYVIFTSGSTGKPKGVAVSHRNIVHSTHARTFYYDKPVGRFLLLSSFAFDSSMVGLYWTLCSGGTLVLPEAGMQRDPKPVAQLIADQKVTHMLSLPTLNAMLVEEGGAEKLSSLQVAIVAGEACTENVVALHQETLPHVELHNEYGPTEGTVWSTAYRFDAESDQAVSIGKPIPNSQIYLLDDYLNPVPFGVVGELYIGGEGVARGYLNRPDLTAERFIPDPFTKEKSARLYRTGDLARYRQDGNIEFLGRADQQVKIRGYRIELGEIEAKISEHSEVKEAAVVTSESDSEETQITRLVGYVVPALNGEVKSSDIREFLRDRLPDFMIPSMFVNLASMPLTPNGKVDRKALPEPDFGKRALDQKYVAPRNAVEEVLTGIWAEMLDLDKVGIEDNFFDLGGHSILVTQMVSRIREAFQVELTLRMIFEAPTVAELAELLTKEAKDRDRLERVAQVLLKVSNLSDDEAEAMLAEKKAAS